MRGRDPTPPGEHGEGGTLFSFEPARPERETRSADGRLEEKAARGPAANAPARGESLGRYRDVVELARGGMGKVFRAFDPEIGRDVAIKVVLGAGEAAARDFERFVREGRVTGQLQHPSIPPVYEMGRTPEGHPYIAMKLVRGRSMQSVIEERRAGASGVDPLAARHQLLDAFLKVCDAVGYAHSQSVVHRDLKPANVMLGEHGEVLVMDWGIARVWGADAADVRAGSGEGGENAGLTATGELMGTPVYMSPEQAAGDLEKIDARSDVYSLGAVLYEILTFSPPFLGKSLPQVVSAVLAGRFLAPSQRAPEALISRELDAVVLKAMARLPSDRYPSAQELRQDIEAYLAGRTLSAARYTPVERLAKWVRRNRALSVAIGAAVAILLVGGAGYAISIAAKNRDLAAAIVVARENERIANEHAAAEEAAKRAAVLQKRRARSEAEILKAERDDGNASRVHALAHAIASIRAWPNRRSAESAWLYRTRSPRLLWRSSPGGLGAVRALVRTRDGSKVIVAGEDGAVRALDARTGRELARWAIEEGGAVSLAASEDGVWVACGSTEGTAYLWDSSSGEVNVRFEGEEGWGVRAIAVHRGGEIVVTGTENGIIRTWDATTGRERGRYTGHTASVTALDLSPDGAFLVSGGSDHTVRAHDLATGVSAGGEASFHEGSVLSVRFVEGDRYVLSTDARTIGMWDLETGRRDSVPVGTRLTGCERAAIAGEGASVAFADLDDAVLVDGSSGRLAQILEGERLRNIAGIALDDTASLLVTGSEAGAVEAWDLSTAPDLVHLDGHPFGVTAVAFNRTAEAIATGAFDGSIRVWRARDGKRIASFHGHDGPVSSLAFDPRGDRLASGSSDQTIRIWELQSHREIVRLEGHAAPIGCIAFSPDGTRLASGSIDGRIRIWDPERGESRTDLEAHTGIVCALAFGPDGKELASGAWDGDLRLWDAATGARIAAAPGGRPQVSSIAFEGETVLAASIDGSVRSWDPAGGKEPAVLCRRSPEAWYKAVVLSPDGKRAATGSDDGSIGVRDVAAETELLRLTGHTKKVVALSFSPDGMRLLSGSDDGSARSWEIETGREQSVLAGHGALVKSIAVSPDGMIFATGSYDRTVRLWDSATGKALACLSGPSASVESVAFSPEGNRIGCRLEDGTVWIWGARTLEPIEEEDPAERLRTMGLWEEARGPGLPTRLPGTNEAVVLADEIEWRLGWRGLAEGGDLPPVLLDTLDRWEREIGLSFDVETGEERRKPAMDATAGDTGSGSG